MTEPTPSTSVGQGGSSYGDGAPLYDPTAPTQDTTPRRYGAESSGLVSEAEEDPLGGLGTSAAARSAGHDDEVGGLGGLGDTSSRRQAEEGDLGDSSLGTQLEDESTTGLGESRTGGQNETWGGTAARH